MDSLISGSRKQKMKKDRAERLSSPPQPLPVDLYVTLEVNAS